MLSGMLQQATIVMGESEGSSQLAYSTIPQLELSLERERERAREGKRNKEAKEAKKERELGREQEGPKEKQREIDDRWKKKHTRGNPQAATD